MITKKIFISILFIIVSDLTYGQKLTKTDSSKLLTTWKKTSKYILSKNTLKLKELCLDTIECALCGYRNDTIVDNIKSLSYFLSYGLIKLNDNKKLWEVISTHKPIIVVGSLGEKDEKTYGLTYTLYLANELGKNHESVQVIFDYVIKRNDFKLAAITTVP
jgi:hypothetical protein